jgi:hypothetical protein
MVATQVEIVQLGGVIEDLVKPVVLADIMAVALDSTAMVVILLGVVAELLGPATVAVVLGVLETVE